MESIAIGNPDEVPPYMEDGMTPSILKGLKRMNKEIVDDPTDQPPSAYTDNNLARMALCEEFRNCGSQ